MKANLIIITICVLLGSFYAGSNTSAWFKYVLWEPVLFLLGLVIAYTHYLVFRPGLLPKSSPRSNLSVSEVVYLVCAFGIPSIPLFFLSRDFLLIDKTATIILYVSFALFALLTLAAHRKGLFLWQNSLKLGTNGLIFLQCFVFLFAVVLNKSGIWLGLVLPLVYAIEVALHSLINGKSFAKTALNAVPIVATLLFCCLLLWVWPFLQISKLMESGFTLPLYLCDPLDPYNLKSQAVKDLFRASDALAMIPLSLASLVIALAARRRPLN